MFPSPIPAASPQRDDRTAASGLFRAALEPTSSAWANGLHRPMALKNGEVHGMTLKMLQVMIYKIR